MFRRSMVQHNARWKVPSSGTRDACVTGRGTPDTMSRRGDNKNEEQKRAPESAFRCSLGLPEAPRGNPHRRRHDRVDDDDLASREDRLESW